MFANATAMTRPNRLRNPLVLEQGLTPSEAKAIDHFGKGGGLVNGLLVCEFPERHRVDDRKAA
jgi:hypothetical protein